MPSTTSRPPSHLVAGVLLLALVAPATAAAQPLVGGPITGGERGRPFTSAVFDLAEHGYVEEEFFLEGSAATYAPAPGTSLTADGRWDLVVAGRVPYATRILVRRPASAARFSGTVVVEWLNVTGGWDIDAVWAQVYTEILRSGYAWVGVSAQRAAVNGPPALPGVSQPLTTWDPERYGALEIADDALSFDIFSQAGRVVGRSRTGLATDPLGGLAVKRVLATGASQSAHRLASYVDGVHPLARVYDGFLVVVRFGRGTSIAPGIEPPAPLFFRSDLETPVFVVNTETEALASFAARQPDSDAFRYWEVAGGAHQPAYVDATIDAQIRRDLGFALPDCDPPANTMPVHYVLNAALDHLDRWARPPSFPPILGGGGAAAAGRVVRRARRVPPPRLPPIAIAGDPPEIVRDAFGNALGGIRLPSLAVPTAQYGPVGAPEELRCDLRGFTIPFPPETLLELYPDHASYLRRFSSATFLARRAGYLLPEDAREARRRAGEAAVP